MKVKLIPDADARAALADTLDLCNRAANEVAVVAHERRITKGWDLREVTYGPVREMGLSAQPAQQVIRKVTDAYKTRRANARAGNYGELGSERRERITSQPITFRPESAQPYDDRCLSWDHQGRTVSICTIQGRVRVPFLGKRKHMRTLAAHRKGESDLLLADGEFYLIATIDIPEKPVTEPEGFIGVDLGIANLAVTSDAETYGSDNFHRKLRARKKAQRWALQKIGTKSAKRKLKKVSGRESRRMTDMNHSISKKIVAEAERTGRGIAIEELTGIRARVRHRKPQRATFNNWAFAQLGAFIAYKATAAGVALQIVDPAYTSQMCSRCGHTSRKNRTTQDAFQCTSCHLSLQADYNAALNIAHRGDADRRAALVALAA